MFEDNGMRVLSLEEVTFVSGGDSATPPADQQPSTPPPPKVLTPKELTGEAGERSDGHFVLRGTLKITAGSRIPGLPVGVTAEGTLEYCATDQEGVCK